MRKKIKKEEEEFGYTKSQLKDINNQLAELAKDVKQLKCEHSLEDIEIYQEHHFGGVVLQVFYTKKCCQCEKTWSSTKKEWLQYKLHKANKCAGDAKNLRKELVKLT